MEKGIDILINDFNDGKILSVNVKLNNTKANFLLDTGASTSIIDLRKIDKFTSSKPSKSYNMSSLHDDIDTYQIKIENFDMGGSIIKNKTFQVADLINLNNTFSTNYIDVIDGILGNDVIFDLVSKIDIEEKTIILK